MKFDEICVFHWVDVKLFFEQVYPLLLMQANCRVGRGGDENNTDSEQNPDLVKNGENNEFFFLFT